MRRTRSSVEKVRETLIPIARKMTMKAYAKYSGFRVGAALLDTDGNIHTGCNVENISYGLTNCAERTAVFKAVSEGHKKFKAIAIASSGRTPAYPCGACRQVMTEFGDILVFIDKDQKVYRLSELIPHGFEKID